MDERNYQSSNDYQNKQVIAAIILTFLLLLLGIISYIYIKKTIADTNQNVLNASTNQLNPTQNISPSPQAITNTPTTIPPTINTTLPNKPCAKNGPAQKWEYLDQYKVKEGDTLQSIASSQLHDDSRINEIIKLNGAGPYIVGSTLYLPPISITKSSGNIKEVYGMLVEKDSSFWHLSYSTDPKGIGILIPEYWFNDVTNSNSFTLGDCVSILLDDGNKVFLVTPQQ